MPDDALWYRDYTPRSVARTPDARAARPLHLGCARTPAAAGHDLRREPTTVTLTHVTLNSGHTRASPRHEVADAIVAALGPRLEALLGGQRVPLPELGDGYSLTGTAQGRGAIATVWAVDRRVCQAPLVTFGICGAAADSAALWRLLHLHHLPELEPLATDPALPPTAPWCAARIDIGAIAADHSAALAAIGDLERCVAWTLIERWSRLA
jgi:hypothetical protein